MVQLFGAATLTWRRGQENRHWLHTGITGLQRADGSAQFGDSSWRLFEGVDTLLTRAYGHVRSSHPHARNRIGRDVITASTDDGASRSLPFAISQRNEQESSTVLTTGDVLCKMWVFSEASSFILSFFTLSRCHIT